MGTNTTNAGQMFEYSALSIMAAQNGTTVEIDANADGTYETSVTLNEGGTYLEGAHDWASGCDYLRQGARVRTTNAGKPIQVKFAKAASDPRFQRTIQKLEQSATKARAHTPAAAKAAQAQAAAQPPANEKLAVAKAGSVESMQAAETSKPEGGSFLAMLRAEIQKVMPKKTEDAGEFMQGGDKDQLKGAMTGNISQQKEQAAGNVQAASAQPPDPSRVEGKEVTPLPADQPPAPTPVDAGSAMPPPAAPAEVSLEGGKQDADKALKDAEVTPTQLQKANDPRFSAVLTARSEVDKQAASLPQQYRAGEQKTIGAAVAAAQADEKQGVAALGATQRQSGAGVKARQLTAKQKDELERKKVAETIEGIYNETKRVVDAKLESLDKEVEQVFDAGTEAAIQRMKSYVDTRFDERYSGISGAAAWLRDKLLPLPPEVKAWFDEANKLFMADLDALVVRVAALVETRLKEAKDEVGKGQKRIKEYVQGLPANLQAVGKAAEQEVSGRFDELRKGVDDKKNDLAQKLAQRYKDASEKGAAALQEMKDAHKSLVEKVKEAVEAVVKVLREFKNRVMGMLKKGKETIGLIVADPISFLKNLLNAVKKGFTQFVANIWSHLKAGFMKWMFGTLASAGVQVPSEFSLGSILKLVLQILGLTYAKIRAKAVKLIGERNVMLIEKAWELISALITGGPAALWEKIKEFLGNLKEMVIDALQDWVVTTLIKAAVTKLVTMFNPVGAIVQAIITIYNTVMFFIERIQQIMELVEAVINSVHSIATGAIDAAASWVEQALARTIPVIIGFLARLIGLGGLSDKIQGIIKKIQSTVDKAVDKLIDKIVTPLKKLFGGGKGKDGKPDSANHAAMAKAAAQELAKKLPAETVYEEARAAKEKQARDLETRYNQQLQKPVKMKISFAAAAKDKEDNDIDFHIRIAPNDFDMDSAVEGLKSSIPTEAGLHGDLKGASGEKEQESHHVPPKGLLGWIVKQANELMAHLTKSKSGKATLKKHSWISKIAGMDPSVFDPGDPLAAIAINKHTHIKKIGKPAEDKWRAHFGAGTGAEILKRLKDKRLTLIYRKLFSQLSDDEKAAYRAELEEAGIPVPAPGEADPVVGVLSTQFFHTELTAILKEKQKHGDTSAERFRKDLGSLAKGAYAQSREAVTIALEHSKRDGTKEQRQQALTKLKGLSRSTWNTYDGMSELKMF
ncbi:MAG: hypothetical protein HGA45_29740 [Chloroflexales bacterium]|nr:hypothetical protein [Chloroflexales bacterium]